MHILRGTRLWAGVLALALLAPVLRAQTPAASDQQTQLATVEQLKTEAFKAFRSGNLDRSDELIRTSASMSNDQSLAQMSQWIGQYKTQRADFLAERHKQYDKVVADVNKLIENGFETFAIDKAGDAFVLSDDKDNFNKVPWVATLVQRGAN